MLGDRNGNLKNVDAYTVKYSCAHNAHLGGPDAMIDQRDLNFRRISDHCESAGRGQQ